MFHASCCALHANLTDDVQQRTKVTASDDLGICFFTVLTAMDFMRRVVLVIKMQMQLELCVLMWACIKRSVYFFGGSGGHSKCYLCSSGILITMIAFEDWIRVNDVSWLGDSLLI